MAGCSLSLLAAAVRRASAPQGRLIHRILRVDHSGELAANQIYAGQMAILSKSATAPLIQEMWMQEREHLDELERQCALHGVTPSLLNGLFVVAGFTLGAASAALAGEKGAMACTVAVEELIGQHYNEQLKTLLESGEAEQMKELLALLRRLRDEELEHLDTALDNNATQAPMFETMKKVVQGGCRAAIFAAQRI